MPVSRDIPSSMDCEQSLQSSHRPFDVFIGIFLNDELTKVFTVVTLGHSRPHSGMLYLCQCSGSHDGDVLSGHN